MNKIIWRLVLGIGFLCLPITCMNGLVLVNMVNPMAMGFLTSFSVVNQSQETVYVTPIGTVGREGKRYILPLSPSARLSLPLTGPFEITLPSAEKHQFTYDWDDINFSELAVRNERGEWFQLVTDPNPTKNQYHQPEAKEFMIPLLSQLPKATSGVVAAARSPRGRSSMWWTWFFLIGLLGPALVFLARKRLNRLPPPLPAVANLETTFQP